MGAISAKGRDLTRWARTTFVPGTTHPVTIEVGEKAYLIEGALLPAGDYELTLDQDGQIVHATLVKPTAVPPTVSGDDGVDHPAHYGGADDPYEAIKVIEAWGVGFHLGTVLKYLARAGNKPGEALVKDLKKARWYLDRAIQLAEEES